VASSGAVTMEQAAVGQVVPPSRLRPAPGAAAQPSHRFPVADVPQSKRPPSDQQTPSGGGRGQPQAPSAAAASAAFTAQSLGQQQEASPPSQSVHRAAAAAYARAPGASPQPQPGGAEVIPPSARLASGRAVDLTV